MVTDLITIYGNTPSKSNSYKLGTKKVKNRSIPFMFKSSALLKYENMFFIQFPPKYRDLLIPGYFEIILDVFYPSQRSDLDNSLKIVLDCLQSRTKTIKNDNKCTSIIAKKALDKK